MNGTYKIIGGNALKGDVIPIPNKNALMSALPLAVIARGGMSYPHLPKTTDVGHFLDIYQLWGAEIEERSEAITHISCDDSHAYDVDAEIGKKFRGSFSFVGPLLARYGRAVVPIPGGCKLGMRSLSVHINGFKELGINIQEEDGILTFSSGENYLREAKVWLLEASVTATLNISMYAAASDMEVHIVDAACEPHVCDILNTLVNMGAVIEGIGTNHLHIKGNENLKSCEFTASPDYVDIAGYCVAAGITGGEITIKGANLPSIVDGMVKWFKLFGLNIKKEGDDLIAIGDAPLDINTYEFPLAGVDMPKFVIRPWPGFPVDVLPVMVTLATKAKGNMLFQNWMYESGFDFVRELVYLGAEIYMSDPQRIIVMEKPIVYKGGEVGSPGIIQGTKAIFLAALADNAETILHGTDILKRRYPNIFETYRNLGADIR